MISGHFCTMLIVSNVWHRITMLEEELGRMAPDLGVIEEWKRKDASYTQRLADLETATAARNEVPVQPGMSTFAVAL